MRVTCKPRRFSGARRTTHANVACRWRDMQLMRAPTFEALISFIVTMRQAGWQIRISSCRMIHAAPLGSLYDQYTTSPFTPEGFLPVWSLSHQIRCAVSPSKHVCTKNLTPFLKLLPCNSLSGLDQLLNPHRLFDADWHGMGVHMRLSFLAVTDPLRSLGNNHWATKSEVRRIRPVLFLGQMLRLLTDWALASIFDGKIEMTCPIAASSYAFVSSTDALRYKSSTHGSDHK
jgi:GPI-anchor transamidase subunit T